MGGFEMSTASCPCGRCHTTPTGIILPQWLPITGWQIYHGYAKYTSRATAPGIPRGAYAHRLVMERVYGDTLPAGYVVHHSMGRRNNCPAALILMPEPLNLVQPPRCPYTGRWLTQRQKERQQ